MIGLLAYLWSTLIGCWFVSRVIPAEDESINHESTGCFQWSNHWGDNWSDDQTPLLCLCIDCKAPAANGMFCQFHSLVIGSDVLDEIEQLLGTNEAQAKQIVDAIITDMELLTAHAAWN